MQQTIDYILGTLPPPDMASQAIQHIQIMFGKNARLDLQRNNSKRLDIDLIGEGEKSLFSWDVKSRERWENTAELSEYGYDGYGRLCLLGHYGRLERPGSPDGLFRLETGAVKPPVVEHMVGTSDNLPVEASFLADCSGFLVYCPQWNHPDMGGAKIRQGMACGPYRPCTTSIYLTEPSRVGS